MHREMSEIWAVIDADADARVIGGDRGGPGLQRRGRPRHDRGDDRATTRRCSTQWRDARTIVEAHARVPTSPWSRPSTGWRSVPGWRWPSGRHQHHGGVGTPVGRARPAGRGRRRPRRDAVAAAVRHGQGEVLPSDGGLRRRPRGRAHRARDAVRPRRRGRSRRPWRWRGDWRRGVPPPCNGRGAS